MSFGNFLRRISFDSEKLQDEADLMGGNKEAPTQQGKNTFFANPTRLLESMNAKTGNLVSDLNQKLDISGKIGSIKQASVGTFEQVAKSTGVTLSSTQQDTTKYSTTTEFSGSQSPSYSESLTKESYSASPTRSKQSEDRSHVDSPQPQLSTDSDTGSSNLIRRQSMSTGPRPPRPPPPSSAALSRAMSLDETNMTVNKRQGTHYSKQKSENEQYSSQDKYGKSGKDRVTFKQADDTRLIQPSDSIVIEEEEDSSASEYGDHGDLPIYRQEPELGTDAKVNENKPVNTAPSTPTVDNNEKMQEFMETYVSALILGRSDYLTKNEVELQESLLLPIGRIAFVSALEQEAKSAQGLLDLHVLPKLLEQISVLLVECQNAEDFAPAKKLLTTSLKFYTHDTTISSDRTFLFAYIKTQPIWQSLRFWNACFFQSLQEARAKPDNTGNVTYGQLKSYLHTMNIFNLHETIKQEFLRKQGDLFNLTDDELDSLQTFITKTE